MENTGKFFILYTSESVVPDYLRCDVIIDGEKAKTIQEVQEFLNENQFLLTINANGKDSLLNSWNIIKVKYYEKT